MIRPAEPRDAQDLGLIRRRAARIAYEGFVDAARLDEPEDLGVWEQRLADPGPARIWVFDQNEQVAGFAAVGDSGEPGVGFLHALYVDPVAQGAGVGRRLHEQALDGMRDAGYESAALRVPEDAGHARTFFENRGWEHQHNVEDVDPQWDVITVMYRRGL